MGGFHLHQEYSSTPIHHIILYYIVQIQENLPERNSSSKATVASQLSLGPDLFPTLCVVFTTTLALAHYALHFSPRKISCSYFPLEGFLYTAHANFKAISLRTVNSFTCQPTIFQLHSILAPRAYQTSFLLYALAHINTSFQIDHCRHLCHRQISLPLHYSPTR
jgi:hypothetical protein